MFERLRQRLKHTGVTATQLSEEESRARAAEREHEKQGRRRGEGYVRTFVEPLTNYRPDPPPLPRDEE